MAAIRIGTSEEGGTFWSQAEAISRVLARGRGPEARVLETRRASVGNALALEAGRIDFGFMASDWIGRARNGEPPFDAPVDLRMAAPASSGAMFFIARADGPLRSVGDMAGRRVAVGARGGGMAEHARVVLGALGIGFDPVHLSFEDGGAALAAGEVDAQWQCPYPNAVMRRIAGRVDVRVLDYAPGQLEAVLEQGGFYRREVMPRGLFRGVGRDTPQAAVVNVVVAHARTGEEEVRGLVAAMLANAGALARENALFRGLGALFAPLRTEGRRALEFGGVPLHAGALRAYREAGYLE